MTLTLLNRVGWRVTEPGGGIAGRKGKGGNMYYKVLCRTSDERLLSSSVEGKAEVEYKPGKYAKARKWLSKKGYDLLVFNNKRKAMEFLGNGIKMSVWKCKIKGRRKELPVFKNYVFLADGKLLDTRFGNWPDGTVMAKEVKITEPVPMPSH